MMILARNANRCSVVEERIQEYALVDSQSINPSFVFFSPKDYNFVCWGSRSFNFYMSSVAPGTHLVKVQWCIQEDVQMLGAHIIGRTLNVIVFPAT